MGCAHCGFWDHRYEQSWFRCRICDLQFIRCDIATMPSPIRSFIRDVNFAGAVCRTCAHPEKRVWTIDMASQKYLTVAEASRQMEITPWAVRRLCRDGRLIGVKRFGNSWMIPFPIERVYAKRGRPSAKSG